MMISKGGDECEDMALSIAEKEIWTYIVEQGYKERTKAKSQLRSYKTDQ